MFHSLSQLKVKVFILIGFLMIGSIGVVFVEPFLRDLPYRLGYVTLSADYSRLQNLLQTKQWQAADLETMQIMLQLAHRERQGFLSGRDLERLPCADLKMIDQLWVQHSNNRFGFSIQRRIFESIRNVSKPLSSAPKKQNSVAEDNPVNILTEAPIGQEHSAIPPEVYLLYKFSKRVGWENRTGICTVPGMGISLYPHPENCKGSMQVDNNTSAGQLPSWGVFMPQPYSNFRDFSTPPLVKRQEQCNSIEATG